MASRPSSTSGSTSGSAPSGTPEPAAKRVVAFAPRERSIAAANDNGRPPARAVFDAVGAAFALALALAAGLYLYLS